MNQDQTELIFDEKEEKQTANETVQPKVEQKEEGIEVPAVSEKPIPSRTPRKDDEDDGFADGAWGELGYRKR